jgi:LPXTG-site transpeptidase (sortase) family protein
MFKREESKKKEVGYLKYLGILLLLGGLGVLIATFFPIIKAYINYYFTPEPQEEIKVEIVKEDEEITQEITKDTQVVFVDQEFGLYIPKIGANSKVIRNVDPYKESEYNNALISGVAHAKGTALPNQPGNVFLFAHSAVNFYERRKYNVYFYLLDELEKEDEIYVSYQGEIYMYSVLEVKRVDPSEVEYLGRYLPQDTLTLMTCWPAGANIKRTIVVAVRAQE